MWIRWTLPRLRIDQVMTTCLKYCTPIAAAMFLGVMLWQLFLPGGLVPGSFRAAAGVREGWLEQSYRKESAEDESLSLKKLSRHISEVSR
jgi:NADH-quinone oxidoreductase subunit H